MAASEERTIAAVDQRIATAINASEQRVVERLTEVMRDMQSEILRGLEAFARGNFSRLHMQDTRISSVDHQILATNERITAFEVRRPPL